MPYAVVFKARDTFDGDDESPNHYSLSDEFPFLCEDNIETETEAEDVKILLDKLSYVVDSKIIIHP